MEKGIVYHNITIPSDDQATIIAQPSECPFDLPPFSVTTRRSSVLGGCFASTSAMRTDQFNSPCGQPGPQRITVIATVSNQPYGFASGTTRTRAGHSNRTQRFLDESDFRWGRRVQVVSQSPPEAGWLSTTTIHFVPLPRLVFPTPSPLF